MWLWYLIIFVSCCCGFNTFTTTFKSNVASAMLIPSKCNRLGQLKSTATIIDEATNKNMLEICGNRFIVPGDYVVSEKYGIGRYLRLIDVDLTPASTKSTLEKLIVIEFADCEVSWFERIGVRELYLYRSSDVGEQELSSISNPLKWTKRKSLRCVHFGFLLFVKTQKVIHNKNVLDTQEVIHKK